MAGGLVSIDAAASMIGADSRTETGAAASEKISSSTSDSDFETIYALRRREVIRFLIHYGIDLVEAEDITQEVFLNVLKTPERKRESDHFFRWLLVCAKNMAINRQRKEKKEMLAPSDAWRRWEDTISNPAVTPDIQLHERERWRLFHQALSRLTAIEQQSVLLRCQGRTFREIGLALDLPLRSAIYTTSTALQKMQRWLKNV